MTIERNKDCKNPNDATAASVSSARSIEWYHKGEFRIVEIAGVQIVVRFSGRKGRRARIAIIAPHDAQIRAGSELVSTDRNS
ncbi:MAG TPA: hypothetical protein VHZ24_15505 [Pirellulales bacterium]|jgi:hypothetical protein|nr:hypothetical protein [Pirellulales bacterium]